MARYDDWTVTKKHRDVVDAVVPDALGDIQLWRHIPGIVGRKITPELRSGVYIQPLNSEVIIQYSGTQDIRRSSLLVICSGLSHGQMTGTSAVITLLEAVRTLFANKRVMGYDCELYSGHEFASYLVDDAFAREKEAILIELSTTLREDR